MSLAGGLHYVVLFSAYAVLWFLCLFCLLPIGLGSERDPDDLAENVRRAARRAAHDAWGKKPVTRVLVTEL
jgi:predicted secreted protein